MGPGRPARRCHRAPRSTRTGAARTPTDDDASNGHGVALAAACIELAHTRLAPRSLRFSGEVGVASDGIVDHIGAFYLGAREGYRGGLLRVLGNLDGAVESLRRASVVNRRIGAIVFALKTDLDLAEVLVARAADEDLAEVASVLDGAATVLARIDLPHEQRRCDRLSHMTT